MLMLGLSFAKHTLQFRPYPTRNCPSIQGRNNIGTTVLMVIVGYEELPLLLGIMALTI